MAKRSVGIGFVRYRSALVCSSSLDHGRTTSCGQLSSLQPPLKGDPLRCASLRDDAFDWGPGLRKELPLMKRFDRGVFTNSLFAGWVYTLDKIIESVG
jgi:hypothetical protein